MRIYTMTVIKDLLLAINACSLGMLMNELSIVNIRIRDRIRVNY